MHAAQPLPDTPCTVILFFFLYDSDVATGSQWDYEGKRPLYKLFGKILHAFIHFCSSILLDPPPLTQRITVMVAFFAKKNHVQKFTSNTQSMRVGRSSPATLLKAEINGVPVCLLACLLKTSSNHTDRDVRTICKNNTNTRSLRLNFT